MKLFPNNYNLPPETIDPMAIPEVKPLPWNAFDPFDFVEPLPLSPEAGGYTLVIGDPLSPEATPGASISVGTSIGSTSHRRRIKKRKRIARKFEEEFISANIPLSWFLNLHGDMIKVALAIWHRAKFDTSNQIILSSAECKKWRIGESLKRRGLKKLEELGLISLSQETCKNRIITINCMPYIEEKK